MPKIWNVFINAAREIGPPPVHSHRRILARVAGEINGETGECPHLGMEWSCCESSSARGRGRQRRASVVEYCSPETAARSLGAASWRERVYLRDA